MRRPPVLRALALGAATLAALALGGLAFLASSPGGRAAAGLIGRIASSPDMKISIGGLAGLLSGAPQATDIVVSDAGGPWLRIDWIAVAWRPVALLGGAIDIGALDVGAVDVLRKPAPGQPKPSPGLIEDIRQALSWRPPLAVRVGALQIGRVALAKPVLGTPAAVGLSGSADLGATGAVARLALDLRRLDAPGRIAARADIAADGARLRIAVDASEPAGGLVARLAALPGLPPVEIHMSGDGALDAFAARLDARAGDVASASGDVSIAREGAARRVNADLVARVSPLLPKDVAALFEKDTRIKATGSFTEAGAVAVDRLTLEASAFRLEGQGARAPDGAIKGHVAAHGLPPQAGAAFTARTLEAQADISGTIGRPEGAFTLLVAEARGPMGAIGRIDADASIASESGSAGGFDVKAQGTASGLALADPALAQALGANAKFRLRAHAAQPDDLDIGSATIETGAGKATFAGRAGAAVLDGKATLAVPDLSRFAGLAKMKLSGALSLEAALSGAPRERRIVARLQGAATDARTGLPAVDGLLGRKVGVSGSAATTADGGVAFDRLALVGEHVSALVDGKATQEAADLRARATIPDLKRADLRLAGAAEADIALQGSLARLGATYTIAARDATAAGRAIPNLTVSGAARDLTGAADIGASLQGVVDGKPATGKAHATRAGEGWNVDALELSVGRTNVAGALALGPGLLANGKLHVAAPDLDDFSAFALQKLAGRLNADVTLESSGGRQSAAVRAKGAGLRTEDATVDRFDIEMRADDLFSRPALDGKLTADGVRAGGQAISNVRATAKPAANGATALEISVNARDFSLAGRGALSGGDPLRLDIAQFQATRAGRRFSLAGPATATLRDGGVDLKGVAIAAGAGRLTLDGRIGKVLALDAKARALPLSLAALADPALSLDGVLDAEAKIGGTAKAPTGDWRVKISRASAPQTRSAGLPPLEATASGRLSGGRTSVEAALGLDAASRLAVTGSAPVGAGALDLAIKGVVDASLANTMLAANGQTVSGKANVDVRLSGPPAAPIVGGTVDLANGAFADPLNGVSLTKISGRLSGKGRTLEIANLTGATKNGGAIAVAGRVTVDPAAGFPLALLVRSKDALLVDNDLGSAIGDLDLAIAGPALRSPRVTGRVTLQTLEVNVPDRLPVNLKPLPGTQQIDAKGFASQMLAMDRKEKARAARKSSFDAPIDLTIAAPNRIFVRGRGIDAEFGGELKVSGTIQKPDVDGGFEVRRGKLTLLTQRIDITQGKLSFTGGLVPQLDFAAQTSAGGVTAVVNVTGPASHPGFAFTSTPELPQDEVLSRLLFAKASGSLSPFQAVQLAIALAQFTGVSSGVDAFEKMRRTLGVDSLDIDTAGAGGPTVGVSRYIAKGVSVGVRTGVKPDQSSVNVSVDLFKNFRVQSETRVDGKTSVGVGVEWEY